MSKRSSVRQTLLLVGLATALMGIFMLALLTLPAQAQAVPPVFPSFAEPELADELAELEGELGLAASRWQLLRPAVITYTVQPGDNDWAIARRFGLDVDTLRFSNEWMQRNPDLIHPGQQVVILPVKGAYYTVKAGDTLQKIAQRYGVAASDIAQFPLNAVGPEGRLQVGQKLIIPNGRLDYAERIAAPGPARGYPLAWPLRGVVTQGYHSRHRALDIASAYGARVYASHSGRVTYARFSPDGWLGFRVVIVHDNGLTTAYSHLSGIFVEEGQVVSRGQVIGQVGSTGNSTGPHVHFEVFDGGTRVNPLSYLPSSAAE